MVITLSGSMTAELADLLVDFRIVSEYSASVSEAAEILLDYETCGDRIGKFSLAEGIATGVYGLRVVLDDLEIMLLCDLCNRRHIGALSVEVNRNYRLGL